MARECSWCGRRVGLLRSYDQQRACCARCSKITTKELEAAEEQSEAFEMDFAERGDLPTVQSSVFLPTEELCYLEAEALYLAPRSEDEGLLVLTNRRFLFIPDSRKGGSEATLNKFLRVATLSRMEAGFSQANNLQLLCRRCNSAKSDSI